MVDATWKTWPEAEEIVKKYQHDKESIRSLSRFYQRGYTSVKNLLIHKGVLRRRDRGKAKNYRQNWYVTADPFREFTDATWILIAIGLDEQGKSLTRVAMELLRDPEFVIQTVTSPEGQAKLTSVREYLMARNSLYALRLRKRQELST